MKAYKTPRTEKCFVNNSPLLTLALLFIATVAVLVLFSGSAFVSSKCVYPVKVRGEIAAADYYSDSYASSGYIISQIRAAEGSAEAGAILLEVDSPGGSPAASKEIFDALANSSKPVVAYTGDTAASGGYYVAAASDWIVANPNTLTGNIGARATLYNYRGLFDKLGLSEDTIKSGDLKDMGSGYRNMTEEERRIFQEFVDEAFANFKNDVEKGRQGKLTAFYNEVLDARVLSASGALRAGLVDEIGNRQRALEKAAELGGADATACYVPEEFSLNRLFSGLGAALARGFKSELENKASVEFK